MRDSFRSGSAWFDTLHGYEANHGILTWNILDLRHLGLSEGENNQYSSLSFTINHYYSLFITINHSYLLLFIINHYYSLLITVIHYYLLLITIIHCSSLLFTINHTYSLFITVYPCQIAFNPTVTRKSELHRGKAMPRRCQVAQCPPLGRQSWSGPKKWPWRRKPNFWRSKVTT